MSVHAPEPSIDDLIERAEGLRYDLLALAHYRTSYHDALQSAERACGLLAEAQSEMRRFRKGIGEAKR
jgi:hypothetical protein